MEDWKVEEGSERFLKGKEKGSSSLMDEMRLEGRSQKAGVGRARSWQITGGRVKRMADLASVEIE